MYDVVPGALQRLHEADIVSVAGLSVASLGQAYCRKGFVHSTQRQGAQLSGIVEVPALASKEAVLATDTVGHVESPRFAVEVEVQERNIWHTQCTCVPSPNSSPCAHAAALLYQWLSHPAEFVPPSAASGSPTPLIKERETFEEEQKHSAPTKQVHSPAPTGYTIARRGPQASQSSVSISEILAQLGLSELRNIAREYDIVTTGLNKQQLLEAVVETLKQPEAIRKVVATLEKPQRQLLAALTLAGGSMSDDDLRGIFERFGLGNPNQLQNTLVALQNRALIFHTSLNISLQQRISGSVHDIGWHVPLEVHTALRVTLPITPFDVPKEKRSDTLHLQLAKPFRLLADLLLVARALDGKHFESDEKNIRDGSGRSFNVPSSAGGSILLPSPEGTPSQALLKSLQTVIPRPPAYLRFVIRLLRMAGILYRDGSGPLIVLPNVAGLLLGPPRAEVACELFSHWLSQAPYEELFDLQEEGLHLCCRSTPLGQPALRGGELDAENSEARQTLMALIAQAPLHQWISFTAFTRFVYRLNPTFLQRRQRIFSSPHWWLEQEEGRVLRPTVFSDWSRAEGRYLARLVEGPLYWWGVCDLVHARDGRLLAFRLTSLAGLLLNGQAAEDIETEQPQERGRSRKGPQGIAPTMPTKQSATPVHSRGDPLWSPSNPHEQLQGLSVTPDTDEVTIPCSSAYWPQIELIETFAEVAGVENERLRYQLSPKSLSEAMGRGKDPAALLEVLQNANGEGMEVPGQAQSTAPTHPPETSLRERLANYGRVRLYTGVALLELADTSVLRELSATTSLEKQVVQSVSPTLLILKKQGAERLVEELKRRGQVPLLHEEESYGAE